MFTDPVQSKSFRCGGAPLMHAARTWNGTNLMPVCSKCILLYLNGV